jgi:glucose/arabinose dehydrogenase
LFLILFLLVSCQNDTQNTIDETLNDSQENKSEEVKIIEEPEVVFAPLDLKEEEWLNIMKRHETPSVYRFKWVPTKYELIKINTDSFDRPLQISRFHKDDENVYVVEKAGRVYKLNLETGGKTLYIDISDRVTSTVSENGLLGFVFHYQFDDHPYIFMNYTGPNGTRLSRFLVDKTSYLPDMSSEEILLEIPQPYNNHNGGHMLFGEDGLLYISSGDGGSGGDPFNHGQNLSNRLGTILRIDVTDTTSYDIPESNPFKGNELGIPEEIFAYGLRNPWKFSFDKERNILLAADVGQDKVEEINIVRSGMNYGWPKYEGSEPYKDLEIEGEVEFPIYEYKHPIGKSITGGYTYYGKGNPSLYGIYVYGDFISGKIWGLHIDRHHLVINHLILETDLKIVSFGLDNKDEIYVVDYIGHIYKLVEKTVE